MMTKACVSQPRLDLPELAQLRATAIRELRIHGRDQGVCRSAFPCPRAELAAFTLDAL